MAEGQMGAKEKGVSSDDINNLSDSAYQNLLDEALNIKSVSMHNKSPILQKLLKGVAKDDDDFSSNVREMVDVVTEGSAIGKKLRRRAKDDQHRLQSSSAAARNSQGGSLQNLTGCGSRKSDVFGGGEGRGRGRLQKSGSINSFISVVNDKLELLTGGSSWGGYKLKTRSRSQGVSENEVNSVLAGESVIRTSDVAKTKKCNYGSLSFDGATKSRCCTKQTRRKSTPSCPGDLVGRCETVVTNCGEGGDHEVCGSEEKWTLPRPGEEIEMMEIDHSDEDCPHEKTPLLKSGQGKVVGRKINGVNHEEGSVKFSTQNHEPVDKVISLPFQKETAPTKSDEVNGEAKRERNNKYGDCPPALSGQLVLNSLASKMEGSVQQDLNHDNVAGNWVRSNPTLTTTDKPALSQQMKKKKNLRNEVVITSEFNQSDSKVSIVRSQLDVNGNPMDEQLRNSSLHSSIQRACARRDNQELIEVNRSFVNSEGDKRRKHKRSKANSTLKEMKAGEIQGNRGDDPLDSLVEFINSSDKKTSAVKNVESTNSKLSTKNNKVQQSAKAKKQEKENNKRNLPTVTIVDNSSKLVIKNNRKTSETCDIEDSGTLINYDILKIGSIVEKITRNASHVTEPAISGALEEHINGTIKIQTVRKAHSWEAATLPNVMPMGKTLSVECDVMDVSCDGGLVIVPCGGGTSEPAAISSFVSDFYAMADVPQVVEDSEFHVVTKKHRRNNRNVARVGNSLHGGRNGRGDRVDLELSGGNEEREFSKFRWNCSRRDEMMLLAGLPIAHQRGSADSRRKSTSSMPPSDHSSVDNSDLDSVHSLPVKSTTVKPTIAKTSSSSSNTPQASYADIAKMAATPPLSSSFSSPSQAVVQRIRSTALPVAQQPAQVAQHGVTPLGVDPELKEPLSLPPRNFPLVRNNKRDASTCTTDDIPTSRNVPAQQITHWASYPTLVEATGKTDPNSGGALLSDKGNETNDSNSPTKESESSNVPNTTSSSSPESVDSAGAKFQDSLADPPSSGGVGGAVGGGGGGGSDLSCSPTGLVHSDKIRKGNKEEENTSESEKEARLRNKETCPPTGMVMVVTPNLVTKRKKEVVSSQTGSTSSEGSGSSELKVSSKQSRRTTVSKNLPAVVIMNNYKPGPCQVDVSFGFEVNEQLLQMSGSADAPSPSVGVAINPSNNPPTQVMGSVAVAASAAAAVATMVVSSSMISSVSGADVSAETSSASSSPDLMGKSSQESEENLNFNYSNIVDYITQSWDGVVKEIEKGSSGFRHVKYHNNN